MSERIPTIEEGARLEITTAQCSLFLIRIITEMALAKAAKEGRVNQDVIDCVRDRSAFQASGEYHVQPHSDAANQGATDFFNHLERYFGEEVAAVSMERDKLLQALDSIKQRVERLGEDLSDELRGLDERIQDLTSRAEKSESETFEREDLPVLKIMRLVLSVLHMPGIGSSITLEFQGEGIVIYFTSSSQLSITPYTVELKGLAATRFTSSGRLVLDESATGEQLHKLKLSAVGTTEEEVDSKHGFWPELIDELKRSAQQHDTQAQADLPAEEEPSPVTRETRMAVKETMNDRGAATPSRSGSLPPNRKPAGSPLRRVGRLAVAAAFLAAPVATFHYFFGLNKKGVSEFTSVILDGVENHEPSKPFPFLESSLPNQAVDLSVTPVYIFDASGALMQYPPCKK